MCETFPARLSRKSILERGRRLLHRFRNLEIVRATRRRTMSPATMPRTRHWACTTQSCGPTSPHPRSHRALWPWQDLGRVARNGQYRLRCPTRVAMVRGHPRRTTCCSTPRNPQILREEVIILVQALSSTHEKIVGEFFTWHWRSLVRILKFLQERASLMTIL